MLKPTSSGILGGCPRTGLLWSLECLAWKSQNLPRVVSILAQLSRTKISDNWANKPIGSLEAIFRSWMPQTAASLEERRKTLESLSKRHPDVGWEICVEQFNPGSRFGDHSYRPHWRSDASGAGQPVRTRKEIYEFARRALDLALAWPSHDERTLGDLVERVGGMAEEDHAQLWKLIDAWAVDPKTTDTAKATLRERIRRFALTRIGRRRVEDEATRTRARDIYTKLEPSDPVIRHGWLFAKQWVEESADELEEDDIDFTAREERIHALRTKALADVWSARGFDGAAALLAESGSAPTVGRYAALCVTDSAERADFLLHCLGIHGNLEQKADACMLGFLWTVDSEARQALLRGVADRVDTEHRVRLFNSSPFEKVTWLTVDEYGTEISTRYWKEVFPQWSRRHSDSDLNELVDRLLDAGRPRSAFHAAHMDWARLETTRLKRPHGAGGPGDGIADPAPSRAGDRCRSAGADRTIGSIRGVLVRLPPAG